MYPRKVTEAFLKLLQKNYMMHCKKVENDASKSVRKFKYV